MLGGTWYWVSGRFHPPGSDIQTQASHPPPRLDAPHHALAPTVGLRVLGKEKSQDSFVIMEVRPGRHSLPPVLSAHPLALGASLSVASRLPNSSASVAWSSPTRVFSAWTSLLPMGWPSARPSALLSKAFLPAVASASLSSYLFLWPVSLVPLRPAGLSRHARNPPSAVSPRPLSWRGHATLGTGHRNTEVKARHQHGNLLMERPYAKGLQLNITDVMNKRPVC